MQAFTLRAEESSQQSERTPPLLDQGGFGGGADLRVAGLQAIRPVTYQVGVFGKTRRRWRLRRLGQRDCLAEASRDYHRESSSLHQRHRVALRDQLSP